MHVKSPRLVPSGESDSSHKFDWSDHWFNPIIGVSLDQIL